MTSRCVRSAALGGGLGDAGADGQALDLEALLRRAATAAVAATDSNAALAEDTLEAFACITSEVLGDSAGAAGADLKEQRAELQTALAPIFEDAAIAENLQSCIVSALFATACGEESTQESAEAPKLSIARPPPPARAPPVSLEGERKYQRRGEVESARAAEYLQEVHNKQVELEKEVQEARELKLGEYYGVPMVQEAAHGVPGAFNPAAAAGVAGGAESSSDSEQEVDDEATLRDREATKRRLRKLGNPVTFFAESDEQRVARLNEIELRGDQDEIGKGSINVNQMVSRQAARGINVDQDDEDFHIPESSPQRSPVPLPALEDSEGVMPAPPALPQDAEDKEDDEFLNAHDEAAKNVSLWLRATLREWEVELTSRQAAEKHLRSFADERGQYRQSKQYLRPLRKALRDGSVNAGIVASIAEITGFCENRQYKEAKEAYMKLAIGNQAWPMGVTAITFHDRPNRHNIGEDNVAHILNDETTRKYVQMIKRLVTYAERRWPTVVQLNSKLPVMA